MKKLTLSFVLVLLIVAIGVATVFAFKDSPEVHAVGETVVLETEGDFLNLKNYVDAEGNLNVNVELATDIYLSRYYAEGKSSLLTSSMTLKGVFDGRGHAIVGLKSNLFKNIGATDCTTAKVENLQLLSVDISNVNAAYALAMDNYGTVQNVDVVGSLSAYSLASGVVANNYGTVSNTYTLVKGTATNVSAIAFYNGDSATVTESTGALVNADNGVTVDDATALLNRIADGVDGYLELNYVLLAGLSDSLSCGLNLYNAPLLGVSNVNLTAVQNGFPVFNADFATASNVLVEGNGETALPRDYVELAGSGTYEDPYLIDSVSALVSFNSYDGECGMLVKSLDFSEYASNDGYVIHNFTKKLDGNGKVISGLNDVNLFQSVTAEAYVKNLYVSAYSSITDTALINVNAGIISNVTLNARNYVFTNINENGGTIYHATLQGEGATLVNMNYGSVLYSRLIGGGQLCFENSPNEADQGMIGVYCEGDSTEQAIFEATCANNASDAPIMQSVFFNVETGKYVYTDDTDVTSIVEGTSLGSNNLYYDAWTFGKYSDEPVVLPFNEANGEQATLKVDFLGFAYKGNAVSDSPVLVFAEDNALYKFKTSFTSYEYTDTYGEKQVSGAESFDISSVTKETLEDYVLENSVAGEIESYLISSGATFKWAKREIGTVDYVELTAVDLDFTLDVEYRFYLVNDYVMVDGRVVKTSETQVTLNYDVVEWGNGMLTILSKIDAVTNLKALINGLGYPSKQTGVNEYDEPIYSANPYEFENENVTYKLSDASGNVVFSSDAPQTHSNFLSSIGSYVLSISLPSTATQSSAVLTVNLTRSVGTLTIGDDYSLASKIGGLEKGSVTYDGEELSFGEKDLYFKNFLLDTKISVSYISSYGYFKENGEVFYQTPPSVIKDAGVYEVNFIVKVEGYEDILIRNVKVYIDRLKVTVRPYIVDGINLVTEKELPYFSAHPEIAFRDSEGKAVDYLVDLKYVSSYKMGEATVENGPYYVELIKPSLSLATNLNYEILADASHKVAIYVVPYALTVEGAVEGSKELTYNGDAVTLSVDESAVARPELEADELGLSFTYSVNGGGESSELSLKDVGTYNVVIKATATNANYRVVGTVSRTVKINYHEITLSAKDVTVTYGNDAVYEIAVTPVVEGETVNESYLEKLVEGTHYTVTSAYVKGVTDASAGELDVTLTLVEGAYAEVEGGLAVGNYLIVGELGSAKLRVTKISLILDMLTSYVFHPDGVTLDFKGTELPENADITFEYFNSLNEWEAVEKPINVGTYRADIYVPETNSHAQTLETIEFTIGKRLDAISGVYVWNKGEKLLKLDGSKYQATYSKSTYTVDVDRTELCSISEYTITYSYRLNGVEKSGVTSIQDVGELTDIKITLDGGANCETQTLTVTGGFAVIQKELRFQETTFNPGGVYTGLITDPNEFVERVENELHFVEGYAPYAGDELGIKCSERDAVPIKMVGGYNIKIETTNPNYYFPSTLNAQNELVPYSIGYTIGNFNAVIDVGKAFTTDQMVYEYTELTRDNAHQYPVITISNYNLDINGKIFVVDNLKIEIDYAGDEQILLPGTYDVRSILPQMDGEDVLISFVCENVSGAVTVKPMEITFDYSAITLLNGAPYGLLEEYTFNQQEIKVPTKFQRSFLRPVNTDIDSVGSDCEVTLKMVGEPRSFKHAGTYVFEAAVTPYVLPDGTKTVACYKIADGLDTFTSVINKVDVEYQIQETSIYVGDELPTSFVPSFPNDLKKPYLGYSVDYEIVGLSAVPTEKGEYAVRATFKYFDATDGKHYENYNAVKVNPEAKELKVILHSFESSLTVSSVGPVPFDFLEHLPTVSGLPTGAEVSYSQRPKNAGLYTVEVLVTKQGFEPKSFEVSVEIVKATGYVTVPSTPKQVEYHVNYELSSADIVATASLNGFRVEGTFAFEEGQSLKYGTSSYLISFTPQDSLNFEVQRNVAYALKSVVDSSEIDILASFRENGNGATGVEPDGTNPTNPFNGYEISGVGKATIKVTLSENLQGKAVFLVDGVQCPDGTYTFTETRGENNKVLIAIMLDDQEIYAKRITVTIYNVPTVEPDVPVTPDDPTDEPEAPNVPSTPITPNTPNEGETEPEKSNLGLIIGIAAGAAVAVIGIVVAVVIIIKKRQDE